MNDLWWIVVIKVVLVFVLLLVWTIFNVWFERRVLGKMQNRKGPIMHGPLGLGQAVGDGVKLIFKEDFRPARTDGLIFNLAPVLTGFAAFSTWSVIPLGGEVSLFGHTTRLQIADIPVGVLLILAIAGMGFYGIVLAGWASNGTYSLLGSMRATAQVISYEIAMGSSLVAVFMFAGSMSTNDIVVAQQANMQLLNFELPLPSWYAVVLIPSFVIYVISMFGETNRLPFDLAECESELVSGHMTDYSAFRYAMYFLAEYINMATVSAVATTLFLGGYSAPWPFNQVEVLSTGWITLAWFIIKVQLCIFFFVWVRGALPRFRYDQFMNLGWKVLIPANLLWITMLALFRGAEVNGWSRTSPAFLTGVGVVLAIMIVAIWMSGGEDIEADEAPLGADDPDFDAFAGGYPVPPMPGTSSTVVASVAASEESAPRRAATTNGDDE